MEYFKNCMTQEQLEQEHRKLVIKMHPDRNPDNPNATAEFQEMQSQYEERKAELNGDYSKARKGRERREREDRERRERERREQERRKKEMAIDQARKNKQRSHLEWKQGEYVYARMVNFTRSMFEWDNLSGDELLHVVSKMGGKEETVVRIEHIVECQSFDILNASLSKLLNSMETGCIYGGRETLQDADPANGIYKKQTVGKVVMFRSEQYCVFGNPMGDQTISDYYMPVGYETLFGSQIDRIKAHIAYEEQEKARLEAERMARIEAEQRPMIAGWEPKLIALSRGLTAKEQKEVAMSNLKTMLKAKFPGAKFTVKSDRYGDVVVRWEDGPTWQAVREVTKLFDAWEAIDAKTGNQTLTPWMEHYGRMCFSVTETERKMSVLTKARILQQLGSVTEAFTTSAIDDEVTVSDFDWLMLHLLVGIEIGKGNQECMSTIHADGRRTVAINAAVNFIFAHSDYCKPAKAKKAKAA